MTNTFPCPRCNHRLTVPDDAAGVLTCPRCGDDVLPPDPDGDARRDRQSRRVWMVLLAVAGGIGIAVALLAGVAAAGKGHYLIVAALGGGLFVIFVTGTGLTVYGKGERRPSQLLGTALYRTLAIAGGVFLLFFTVCIAVGIYFFAACLGGGLR